MRPLLSWLLGCALGSPPRQAHGQDDELEHSLDDAQEAEGEQALLRHFLAPVLDHIVRPKSNDQSYQSVKDLEGHATPNGCGDE